MIPTQTSNRLPELIEQPLPVSIPLDQPLEEIHSQNDNHLMDEKLSESVESEIEDMSFNDNGLDQEEFQEDGKLEVDETVVEPVIVTEEMKEWMQQTTKQLGKIQSTLVELLQRTYLLIKNANIGFKSITSTKKRGISMVADEVEDWLPKKLKRPRLQIFD